ncbi:MAG TPA: acyl-CoA dehydrogenase family protein [Anaerolineales bacterium]|nr:acyl-CoA dehydrogenase family protein [Anaerolineales bacterium]
MIESLVNEKQKHLREEVRGFVREDVPRQLVLDMDAGRISYPREFIQAAARRGLLGLRFPESYGGRGLTWADEIIALEEVGVLGTSLACLYSLPSIVGEALHIFGSEAQKERWLRPVLEGRVTVAEALTEPRGGSDFFGATTTAVPEGDGYILRGQKRFIVGAEGADYFLVYARTIADDASHASISVFVVERGPGVQVERVYGLLGTRGGGTGRVYFRDVHVPKENLIGKENGGAEIFNQMMIPERMTSAAGALGLARTALEIAGRYSDRRKAFGQKIRTFQAVGFKVAESATLLDAASALVYATASAIDGGDDPRRVRRMVSEAKKFATEACWQIVNDAMQIMGGIGYTDVFPIERLLRDARLGLIWTGTSEVMNLVIQHEYYRELGFRPVSRDVEEDAPNPDLEEKVFE